GLVLCLYPLFLAYTNDWLDPGQMVSGSSTLILLYGAGAILGPQGVFDSVIIAIGRSAIHG
ncbi:MAG: MFS transporter, partial [Candidatus Promineifilaceae bacterium]